MNPFEPLRVYPRIQGGTRVEWGLVNGFTDSPPYEFQLQYSEAQAPSVDDWVDVGSPVNDVYYLLDPEQRVFNNFNWACYRVKLTTGLGQYYSPAQNSLGVLSRRWWRIARELIRQELVRLRTDGLGTEMLLLKRRTHGAVCTQCVDPLTKEVVTGDCNICWGTGWEKGYYDPVECIWAELSATPVANDRDAGQARGTVDDSRRLNARLINIPFLFSGDILVEKYTDNRWFVKKYDPLTHVQNVPLIVSAELRLLEYSHPVYRFPLDVSGEDLDYAETLRDSDTPLSYNCRTGYVDTGDDACPNPSPP